MTGAERSPGFDEMDPDGFSPDGRIVGVIRGGSEVMQDAIYFVTYVEHHDYQNS